MLGLINDGYGKGIQLSESLDLWLEDCSHKKKDLIKEVHGRDREETLRLFLSGPAGAGESTAVKVAQRFFFEVSREVGVLWTDSTFQFTAYTGSAA